MERCLLDVDFVEEVVALLFARPSLAGLRRREPCHKLHLVIGSSEKLVALGPRLEGGTSP